MTFRIADTFSAALTKLSGQEQKAAKTAAFDAQMNPDNPGHQMHRVDRARDPHFWTARVNRDIRLVLHKKDGATLLAWVGHHDDAYAWAVRRRIDVHPRTGAAQIVEIRETVEDVIIQRYVEEAVKKPRLFAYEDDDALLSWGVPEDWLDTVRDATEDTVLDIAGHLPAEAGEALLQAATGERPAPAAHAEDPYEHPDAVRRFRLTTTEADLAAALEAPWERWAVWLHPAQKEFVHRDFNGPARVIGSAGTGKTVVALHRAARLARENDAARVLLTTFNDRLADGLSAKLPMLLPDKAVRDRVTTRALGPLAHDLYVEAFGPVEEATPDDVAEAVAAWLARLSGEGIAASQIALLVRSDDELPRAKAARDAFRSRTGIDAEPEIRIMHDAKGSEYRAVAVMACDEDVVPKEARLLEARDEAMIEEIMATERHLLYVAAIRARERLWVSGTGRVSEFLEDLL